MTLKKFWQVFTKSISDTINHDGVEHAGYLAFLALLSFFPFLVLLVYLAGVFGQSQLGTDLVNAIIEEIPGRFIEALKPRIADIISGPPPSLKTIAIISMIWTASSAVEGLRTILNRAYRVETPPAYIWRRLMSIVQFLVIMVIIMAAMLMLILIPPIWHNIEIMLKLTNLFAPHWIYIRYVIAGVLVCLSVGASYYVLPNIRQKFSHVWPGTFLVMFFWLLAGGLLSLYINNFQQVNLVYGSLEGIIVSLLFFYIMGVIYILGAEFNYHVEQALGNKVLQREEVPKNIKSKAGKTASRKKRK